MRALSSALLILSLAGAGLGSAEEVDLEVVHKIKREAFAHSKVMDILFQLTDVNGSRLTGSPGY
jgi:carboxypeptidase Q